MLGVGTSCDLAALYHRLTLDGHEVRFAAEEPMCHDILAGLVPRIDDWRAGLDWVGRDGLVLFEEAGRGGEQDALRRDGFRVVGGTEWGDRLEKDRGYGQSVLAGLGLAVAPSRRFAALAEAAAFVRDRPRRYVLKFDGPGFGAADTYVGQLDDGRDLLAVLAAKLKARGGQPTSFILQDHVAGIEMGVGGYFDGQGWTGPPCLDWEHKRFFPGDLGEFTGEMGTVATFDRSRRFFELTLGRLTALLREQGFRGYLNLNTIVNEAGIWPLEFTARFGYPGFAVLEPLQATPWTDLLGRVADGRGPDYRVRPGFSVGLVLTTRPFPFLRHYVPSPVGLPVVFASDLPAAHVHYGEVGMADGQLVTAGYHGWTMVVTGVGADIAAARAQAYGHAAAVIVPDLRYRIDIGDRLLAGDYAAVARLGLLGD